MTYEIGIVLFLVGATVMLFVTERLPVDLIALLVLSALVLSGVITAEEGVAGFSNSATVTVAAMFVLSAGLFRTGAVNLVGRHLARLSRHNFRLALLCLMVTTGAVSAFINNTAAVAVLMPVALGIARDTRRSPSRLLMPLSFASMFGGVCTLIGTSTNILVSSVAERQGQAAFGMFEFLPLGAVMFAAGTLYMMTVGTRLIPERRAEGGLAESFSLNSYVTEIVLLPSSPSAGAALRDSALVRDLDIDVLAISREGVTRPLPAPDARLAAGDVLRVRCDVGKLAELQAQEGVRLKPGSKWRDADLDSDETALVEAVVAPNSALAGRSLEEARFRETFDATVVALRHSGRTLYEGLAQTRLRAGDALLVEARRESLPRLRQAGEFVLVSDVGLPKFRRDKLAPAVAIMFGVVAAAATGWLPVVAAAVAGCVLMALAGCVTLDEAYRAIEWRVIFLLGGILSLGLALDKTGAARLVAAWMTATVGAWGPLALLSAFYLLTSLLTETMSNNATAALLAPIAIVTAESLGVSPRPFLVAVAFAASASFMTPVGYQTNTLIYGPGHYRFTDFLRVGAPLNLLFWLLATLLIPRIWSF
jgi:di/tricarboxylate transporter